MKIDHLVVDNAAIWASQKNSYSNRNGYRRNFSKKVSLHFNPTKICATIRIFWEMSQVAGNISLYFNQIRIPEKKF